MEEFQFAESKLGKGSEGRKRYRGGNVVVKFLVQPRTGVRLIEMSPIALVISEQTTQRK